MASPHPIRKTVAPEIPDKLYFRIGDVAKLCDVAAYVLRFWETEFPQLKPNKGGTGQRLYRRKDVEMALRIKHLLYVQGFTIPGARQILKDEMRLAGSPDTVEWPAAATAARSDDTSKTAALAALQREMQALQAMLSRPVEDEMVKPEAASTKSISIASHSGREASLRPKLVEVPRIAVVAFAAESEQAGSQTIATESSLAAAPTRFQGDLFGGE